MMRAVSAAALLGCASAVSLTHSALRDHVVDVDIDQSQSVSDMVSDLWADLIIAAEEPIDFAKSDKSVKDKFVKDCAQSLDVHPTSKDAVGETISKLCAKAGGTGNECSDMTKTLWEAHKDKKLKPWCDKTFDWFASKTKPKCLAKCKAYLCKDRCSQQDQVNDLVDEIAAYDIKMNTATTKEKRLKKEAEAQKASLAKIDKVDKTECTPATKNVAKIEDAQKGAAKELSSLKKATAKAEASKDKLFDALKKLKADKKASKAAKSKAEADFKKASDAFLEARKKQAALNGSVIKRNGKLTEARMQKKTKCKKLSDMKADYESDKKTNEKGLKALADEKKKIKGAMDKLAAKKKALEAPLKAALKAI